MRGSSGISAAELPKPRVAALALGKLVDLDRLGARHRHDDELRDAHARLDDESLVLVGVEQDRP